MSERHMDQFLDVEIGPASRDEVLTALRNHSYEVVIALENADGTTLLHAAGWLQQYDPNEDEDACEHFAVNRTVLRPVQDGQGRWRYQERPLLWFTVPKDGIVQYSEGGYRFMLPGGAALVVVPWHGALHVTPSGDLAPGLGGFNATVEELDDD